MKTPRTLEEACRLWGVPDAFTNFYVVPPSHREHLDGAELACEHIAETGTLGNPEIYIATVGDKLMALCPACDSIFKKSAKAGR